MFKKIASLLLVIVFFATPFRSFAWGKKGHQIVAQIASHFLADSTRKKVQDYLGRTSFEDAANWMDESRSNDFYGYMRTWHYFDMEKGETYKPVAERNILTVLHAAITDLRRKDGLKKSAVKTDLLYIFHLVGDLHQPLHVGYSSDKGGNDIQVSYIFKSYSTNLHSVWDTEMIESEKITADTCLALFPSITPQELVKIKTINELAWYKESRQLLDTAYNFTDGFLPKNYVMNNKSIVERQLLLGGIRLAAILEELFK